MPTLLRKLRINRVDLVDRGANPDAHVMLFKREPNPNDPPPKLAGEKETRMDLAKFRTLLKSEPTTQKFLDAVVALDTELQKADQDKPDTFDEVMGRRNLGKVMHRLNEFQMGLFETIERISMSDAAEKTKLVKSAIKAFVQRVGTELPQFIDETMRKDDQRDKIQTLLADIIREGEGTMTEPTKKTETPKADMKGLRKMFAGMARMFGATPEEVSAIDPEISDDDIWKGVSPQLRTRIEASEAATAAEVKKREEAETRVAKLEGEKALADITEEIKGYANMGIDPEKDAVLFQEMTKGLNAEQVKRAREIFKSAHETIATGKAFTELGSRGAGVPADSVTAEVAKRVEVLKAKPEHKEMTEEAAMVAVFAADPDLYEKYRKETAVRV